MNYYLLYYLSDGFASESNKIGIFNAEECELEFGLYCWEKGNIFYFNLQHIRLIAIGLLSWEHTNLNMKMEITWWFEIWGKWLVL